MKSLKFLLFFFLIFIFLINKYGYSTNIENKGNNEQAFVMSSDPVNDFLDIKIKSGLIIQEDSLKTPLKIEVKILNQKGVIVFSATKSVSEFDIFTGGLPEGAYTILCKISNTLLQKSFVVKH